MRILVYSFKGGTGKTTIALNWALTMGVGVITNDLYSLANAALDKSRIYKLEKDQPLPDLPKGVSAVYDFGGYVDGRVVKAMESADAIIIPTTKGAGELKGAIETIKEAQHHNKRIFVVANKAAKGDLEYVRAAIEKYYKVPVLPLKASKAMERVYTSKLSLREWVKSSPTGEHVYGEICGQFDAIIAAVTKNK